jgi:hypothetical protein
MHGKEQIGRGLKQVQLLLQKQRIRTERDEFLLGYKPFDDLSDFPVDQRLTTRNCHHRGTALINRVEAFLDGETTIENRLRVVDLAATEARQVAAKQRLEHEDQRIALTPQQFLLEDVRADFHFLAKGNVHCLRFPVSTVPTLWRLAKRL